MANNSTRGGSRGGSRNSSRNNNPAGHNQYDRGWTDSVTDRPLTAAAAIGGAVAAGVFLWSRRNQISDQISSLSQQITDWREGMGSEGDMTSGDSGSEGFMARSGGKGAGKTQSEIAEEALTLKSTGKKSRRPADSTVDEQTKTGAVAY
jgi:hypothetical protein